MKQITLSIITFFTINLITGQIHNGLITYKVAPIQNTSLDGSNIVDTYIPELSKGLKELTYLLEFDQNASTFYLQEQLENDQNDLANKATILVGRGKYFSKQGKILRETEFTSDIFLIEMSTPISWEVTSEEKMIGKYTCFKAIGTYPFDNGVVKGDKKVEAWFTPMIPAPFGPKQYHGLPGLILELQEENIKFFAVSLELNQKDIAIVWPEKGIKLSEDEFQNYVARKAKERFGRN